MAPTRGRRIEGAKAASSAQPDGPHAAAIMVLPSEETYWPSLVRIIIALPSAQPFSQADWDRLQLAVQGGAPLLSGILDAHIAEWTLPEEVLVMVRLPARVNARMPVQQAHGIASMLGLAQQAFSPDLEADGKGAGKGK